MGDHPDRPLERTPGSPAEHKATLFTVVVSTIMSATIDSLCLTHPMLDSDSTALSELLPLSPPVYHVLLGLGGDSLHGYAIMQIFWCHWFRCHS